MSEEKEKKDDLKPIKPVELKPSRPTELKPSGKGLMPMSRKPMTGEELSASLMTIWEKVEKTLKDNQIKDLQREIIKLNYAIRELILVVQYHNHR